MGTLNNDDKQKAVMKLLSKYKEHDIEPHPDLADPAKKDELLKAIKKLSSPKVEERVQALGYLYDNSKYIGDYKDKTLADFTTASTSNNIVKGFLAQANTPVTSQNLSIHANAMSTTSPLLFTSLDLLNKVGAKVNSGGTADEKTAAGYFGYNSSTTALDTATLDNKLKTIGLEFKSILTGSTSSGTPTTTCYAKVEALYDSVVTLGSNLKILRNSGKEYKDYPLFIHGTGTYDGKDIKGATDKLSANTTNNVWLNKQTGDLADTLIAGYEIIDGVLKKDGSDLTSGSSISTYDASAWNTVATAKKLNSALGFCKYDYSSTDHGYGAFSSLSSSDDLAAGIAMAMDKIEGTMTAGLLSTISLVVKNMVALTGEMKHSINKEADFAQYFSSHPKVCNKYPSIQAAFDQATNDKKKDNVGKILKKIIEEGLKNSGWTA